MLQFFVKSLGEVIFLTKSLKLNLITRLSYLCSKGGGSLSFFEYLRVNASNIYNNAFLKCIFRHEHHDYQLWHIGLHRCYGIDISSLIDLIMCNWHLRPKYVFLSMHIFRGEQSILRTLKSLNNISPDHVCLFQLVLSIIRILACTKV
jgi:hypothetical protein